MKLILNTAIKGMRGVMDDWVYKRFEGETIASRMPVQTDRPPTAAQERTRERFKEGAGYARAVFNDPARKAVYSAAARAVGRTTLWSVVAADYLSPPRVSEVDLAGYDGMIGNLIKIKATDDFEVVSVSVTITDPAGEVVDEGEATKGDTRWVFTAQAIAPRDRTLTIKATAFDRAGNSAALTADWHG